MPSNKPSPWNPWGFEEMKADEARRIINAVYQYPDYECRVECRSGHDFLVVTDLEEGRNIGGAELIRYEDVGAVRGFISAMA